MVLIVQLRHDRARRQCRDLWLVAGQQNPHALPIAKAVRHVPRAALFANAANPSTYNFWLPALQVAVTALKDDAFAVACKSALCVNDSS